MTYDMFKEFQFSSSSRRFSLFIAASSLWLFNESSPHNISIDPQYDTKLAIRSSVIGCMLNLHYALHFLFQEAKRERMIWTAFSPPDLKSAPFSWSQTSLQYEVVIILGCFLFRVGNHWGQVGIKFLPIFWRDWTKIPLFWKPFQQTRTLYSTC